jgi:hypothetical protein
MMTYLVKHKNLEGKAFQYLQQKFLQISKSQIKKGIFVGPQIKDL